MSVLNLLNNPHVWAEYFEYKTGNDRLTKKETAKLAEFIEQKSYEKASKNIVDGNGLSVPKKNLINKMGGKKRTVYNFEDDENRVLKLLSYLLYKYDAALSDGCYSFRKGISGSSAIHRLVRTPNISKMWSYKLDIKNYFNSICIPVLLPILKEITADDPKLYLFFEKILITNETVFEDEIVHESRGVMAGTPTSPFLANIYLGEMDKSFIAREIIYARYSDDIIVFAKSEQELSEYREILHEFLAKYRLAINPDKEKISKPGEAWEYLGVEYKDGKIDLSEGTKQKIKGKIRRKARALYRWKLRKGASDEQTMRVMIRVLNRKLFENGNAHSLTWSRWFFPLVTEKEGFAEVDAYLQKYIRYIATGSHGKKNYKTSYEMLKNMGYKSLVNEYYKYIYKKT